VDEAAARIAAQQIEERWVISDAKRDWPALLRSLDRKGTNYDQ
jgi:hypothetical protein